MPIEDIYQVAKTTIIRHTIQILKTDETGEKIRPIGSGILLEIEDRYFILTASHVVQKFGKEDVPYIKHRHGYSPIDCYVLESDIVKYPNIDIAYIEILNDSKSYVQRDYLPLKINQITPNHHLLQSTSYLLTGYKAENRFYNKNNELRTGASIMFVSGASDEAYKIYSFSKEHHLCLNYAIIGECVESKEVDILVEPHGMSGGGLWLFGEDSEGIFYYLIGIIVELKDQKPMIIMCNSVELIIDKIALDYKLDIF